MTKKLLLITFLLFALALTAQAAQLNTPNNLNTSTNMDDVAHETSIPGNTQFAKAIDDLPLMPGLQLVEDEDVLFAEPVLGRIAETTAKGPVDIDALYNYYSKSLPALGWKKADMRDYIRENDHLRIDAHADGKVTTVQFSVRPLEGK